MRALGGVVLLVAVQGLAGCADSETGSTPTRPSAAPQAPSTPPSQPTASRSGIWGFVMDTSFRRVADARVEVAEGRDAGLSTTTDAAGEFFLAGTFDQATRFRAVKEGYVPATQSWSCGIGSCWMGFYLAVLAPPVDIAGAYRLTFVSDPACTDLPEEVRRRSYDATITRDPRPDAPAGTALTLTASGATFINGLDHFGIGVAGDHVAFWLYGGHNAALVEQVAPNARLMISGAADAFVGASQATISAPFEGWIEYERAAAPHVRCESKDHQLILTRR